MIEYRLLYNADGFTYIFTQGEIIEDLTVSMYLKRIKSEFSGR